MSDKIPKTSYILIIGSMKCGTSALYDYLQGHPEICPAKTKEPEFFSENQRHGVKIEKYQNLWDFNNKNHKYVMEASTGYTKYPTEQNVPGNIFNYGIKPKFLYIIRNPFDRIVSNYNSLRYEDYSNPDITDKNLICISNYFLQLEQYREFFPVEDILILDFDELKSNPDLLLKKAYEFLGLPSVYFPEKYEQVNITDEKTKFVTTLKNSRFGSVLRKLPTPLKQVGQRILYRLSPPREKRLLTGDEREFIYNELRESMQNLHRVYGIDVARWGFHV